MTRKLYAVETKSGVLVIARRRRIDAKKEVTKANRKGMKVGIVVYTCLPQKVSYA